MTALQAAGGPAVAEPGTAPSRPSPARSLRRRVLVVGALSAWVGIVALSRWWALRLEADGHDLVLFTPPILGGYRTGGHERFWIPALTGALLVAALPRLVAALRWWAVTVASAASALAWWLALALVDGRPGIVRGLHWDAELADAAPLVARDPGTYLRTFVDELPGYGIYIRSHPPGPPLVFGALDRAGLDGPWWAATVILVGAALGVVAVLVAIREVAGECWARRAAPFLVLAPSAAWIATSIDALFMGVGAWFVALMVMAMARRGRASDLLAVGAGVAATASILLSYGLVLLGAGAVTAALAMRRVRPLLVAGSVALSCTVLLVPLGYWWIDGLRATSDEYFGLGLDRPHEFFVVGNLGAWALALGPATFVGLALLRDRRMWAVVGGGLAAALIADLSGLSNAEVERIWLPFTIWVVAAGASLADTPGSTRIWLAAQVASSLVLAWFVAPLW